MRDKPEIIGENPMAERAAIVDLGSNSIRMVVFEGVARNPLPIFNEKATLRLGEGLETTGRLSEKGVKKALEVLARYGMLARAMGVKIFEILATAAVRDAENSAEFMEAAQRAVPNARFRILNGEEEADYSACGVLCAVPHAEGLVVDIGGGSLELIHISDGDYCAAETTSLGVIRLAERSKGDMKYAKEIAQKELGKISWLKNLHSRPLYLVGGAFRAVGRLHIERIQYPLNMVHLFRLSLENAKEMAQWCAKATAQKMAQYENVPRKRQKDIPFAAIALEVLLEYLAPKEIIFSAEGLREGWYMRHVAARVAHQDPMQALASEMAERLARNASLSPVLMEWTAPLFASREVSKEETKLRKLACLISDIGSYDHPQYRAEQTYRRVLYGHGVGFEHVTRGFLALVSAVRYEIDLHDTLLEPSRKLLSPEMVSRAIQLGLALRLAYTVCAGTEILLDKCHLVVENNILVLSLGAGGVRVPRSALKQRLERLADSLELPAHVKEL